MIYNQTLTQWIDKGICFCLRHWLGLFLAFLLLVTTIPFLAPIAMAAGWTDAATAIYRMYSLFCHQLPQRSWFLFGEKVTYTLTEINQVFPYTDEWSLRHFVGTPTMGWKVAWSDRMISFYWMTPLWGLVYAALRQHRRIIRPLSLTVMLLALAPLFIDGATHMLNDIMYGVAGEGFRNTNGWLARLTNGAFPGFYVGDHFGTFNWWMRLFTGVLAAWGLVFGSLPWMNKFLGSEENHYCGRVRSTSTVVY